MRSGVQVLGIDDGPFQRDHRGDVLVVGTVFRGGERLEGVLSTQVRRDGRNATDKLIGMITESRFHPQLHYILLDGISLAGFNVVDIARLHDRTGLPTMVVSRTLPDQDAVREALVNHLRGGADRWRMIQRAGPIHPIEGLYCQLAGLTVTEAAALVRLTRQHSKLPEPIRAAHLIAAGIVRGESRGRA
jgi:uncharacterized protein